MESVNNIICVGDLKKAMNRVLIVAENIKAPICENAAAKARVALRTRPVGKGGRTDPVSLTPICMAKMGRKRMYCSGVG